jgi:hypothetical protein
MPPSCAVHGEQGQAQYWTPYCTSKALGGVREKGKEVERTDQGFRMLM